MAEEGGQGEHLLPDQAAFVAAVMDAGFVFPTSNSASVWMTAVRLVFLTFYSAIAVYRSNGDRGRVVFVLFCYVCIITLFFCRRRLETAPPGSATRGKLKVARAWVLLLATVLTVVFSIKVASIMPVAVELLVRGMAVATVLGGLFYVFFSYWKRKGMMVLFSPQVHAWNSAGTSLVLLLCACFVMVRQRSPPPLPEAGADVLREAAWSRARLIVDSGANRHVVGDIWLLEGFRPYRHPLVAKLADGSHLRILGTGHIERGNFSIPNVSLIEGLRDGLISTPQLDTDHGLISYFGNRRCRIMETDSTEVGGAILERDGSYVLRFLNVPGHKLRCKKDEDPKLTSSSTYVTNSSVFHGP